MCFTEVFDRVKEERRRLRRVVLDAPLRTDPVITGVQPCTPDDQPNGLLTQMPKVQSQIIFRGRQVSFTCRDTAMNSKNRQCVA